MLIPLSIHAKHFDNIPMQYTAIFTDVKNVNFQTKIMIFFFFFAWGIDCGCALEPPHSLNAAVLASFRSLCFRAKIRKKNVYPCKTPILLYKVGV